MSAPAELDTPGRAGEPSGILILSLATACGCKCVFCGLPDTRPHTVLSPAAVAAALEGSPTGAPWQEVNLTGGDPLVIPAARALFGEVLSRRHTFDRLSVSTAGVPAAKALQGFAMLEHSPLDVYVSLDGVGELHDQIRRRPGAFAEATRFIEQARAREGVSIALTCVINRLNIDHLDELSDWAEAHELPLSHAVVNSSDHYIRSQPLYERVSLDAEQAERAMEFLARRSTQRLNEDLARVLRGGRRELPCRLLSDGVLLTSDGAVAICGTSQRMVLADQLPAEDTAGAWRRALDGRANLLAGGAAEVCGTCTTNCYAWRTSDGEDGS